MRQVKNNVQLVDLMLAVNNENGNHSGKIEGLQILDYIQLDNWDGEDFALVEGGFKIGDQLFAHHGYTRSVGNIMWDCAWVTLEVAAAIINQAKRQDSWTIEEAESKVWRKWEKDEVFVGKDFKY